MPDPSRAPERRWRLLVAGGVALAALVVLLLVALPGLRTETIAVEVVPGTAERLAAGETVDLLPRTLEVAVGDRLEIVNRDAVTHEVGPYTVAAGQTLRQTFTSVGTLEGACTLHPSGAITIVVR
jgi:plastocyanin